MKMHLRRVATATALLSSFICLPAIADEPAPQTPQWFTRELTNWAGVTGRMQDQLSNPDYLQLRAASSNFDNADPYRSIERWSPARGRSLAVNYPNRYGARISAHLWAPRAATSANRRLPAVVMINGSGDIEEHYWSFAQDLAEHGYIVMTFDPQGAGKSAADPDPRYCDPKGAWRKPQEMGVQEHGSCAGQSSSTEGPLGEVPGVVELAVNGRLGRQGTLDVQELYRQLEPNFILGALDAVNYLSTKSPLRAAVDTSRIAAMGHSLGAYAASMVANGDPRRRFRVGIALDSYAHLEHGIQPRVPTMWQQSEQELLTGPRLDAPPPTALHATRADYATAVHRRVPAYFAVLTASSHQEFDYLGPESYQTASRTGQRVATYFALAWLDRFLIGDRNATKRLRAKVFDQSVDKSSIGAGRFNPSTQKNEPYRIGGDHVASALSAYYVSQWFFDGGICADIRRDCPRARS